MRKKIAILSLFLIGGILMSYTKIGWQPKPSTATMITAARLNHMDEGIYQAHSQLAQIDNKKVSKEELNALGQLKLSGQYDTLLQLIETKPTGAEGIHLVIEDGYTYRWDGTKWVRVTMFQSRGIPNKSIPANKTTFVKTGNNLFNPSNLILGEYITHTGIKGFNETYFRTDYIPIDSSNAKLNTMYVINESTMTLAQRAVRYFCFFKDVDGVKTYVDGGNQNVNNVNIPVDAEYVVITISTEFMNKYWFLGYELQSIYERYYESLVYGKNYAEIDDYTTSPTSTWSSEKIISEIPKPYKRIHKIMSSLLFANSTINIKLLGDSITHGVGGTGYAQDGDLIYTKNETTSWRVNTAGHCWANSLKSYFENKFNCIVKNYGCSGLNSYDYIYNDNAMLKSVVEDDDDIIIIMIGTNDRAISGRTKQKLYNHLQQIYDYVTGLGKEIIFMSGIPASVSNESTGIKEFHMEDVDHVIMKLASENNMEYISVYKLLIDYCELKGVTIDSLLVDGLHPNDIGYDVMFKLICHELGFGIKRTGATW